MAIRIYELAKELNTDSNKIIEFLGTDSKPASGIDDETAKKVREKFAPVKKEGKKVIKDMSEKPEKNISSSEGKEVPKKEGAEAPKKKKPVFLFRPENSSLNSKSFMKNQGGQSSASSGQKARNPEDRRPRPAGQPAKRDGQGSMERRVIRPNVPTTAQQYREYAKEEASPAPVRKPKKPVEIPEETAAVLPAEVQENIPAPVETAPVQPVVKPAEEAPATPVSEAPAAPEKAEPVQEAAPSETKASEPEKEKKPEKEKTPAEDKKETPPVRSIFDRNMGPLRNVYREREEKEALARAAREQDATKNKGREKTAGTPDRRPRDPRNGQNQPRRDGSRPFQQGAFSGTQRPAMGQGGRPQGQNSRPGQGQGRPGGFSKSAGGPASGRFTRDQRSASGAGSAAAPVVQKNDSRSRKNNANGKTLDRQRQDRDRTGKKAENFKNLSKTPLNKNGKPQQPKKEEEVIRMITLPDVITLKDLAEKMKLKPADIIKKLFLQGKMLTVNSELPYEDAEEIALEYNILCEHEVQVDVIEELLKEDEEDEKLMVKRPPVVCVMGHVDHGKTSLLDAIRSTNVTSREAGGITQHIGAYMVECNGEKITFLDTPGHEAFTAMRMRGAQATDIAILVVAADDGVMPQTVEAINHAKAAGVDIIVAVNKIDKPAANIDRVKQELSEYELVPEDWGGSTIFVPVSAKTHENIDSLLEMILLLTEVKELKANPNREMRGIVIEAKLDKGRGPVATVLVQKGTMKVGDFVSAGSFYGRVRAMLDADGNTMKSATPSTPVEILGLNGVPNAGEVCIGHKNERDARSYAETFIAEEKKKMLAETKQKLTMDSLFDQIQAGNIKELPIIVKADVQGSVEAVRQSLEKLSNEEVQVKVIHGGVGLINESDVSLASASNAIVIGFNVRPDTQAKNLADQEHVDLRLYKVIYQAIEDVEAAMKGMLAPVYEKKILGHAEVRMTFKASGVGTIAGSYVTSGTLERGCSARITRGKDLIFEGPLASLKRFKDDVKEVREGYECGIVFEKFNDLMEGDQIEAYKMVQVERS